MHCQLASHEGGVKEETQTYQICMLKEVAQFADGSSFGELALLENQPRSATIY